MRSALASATAGILLVLPLPAPARSAGPPPVAGSLTLSARAADPLGAELDRILAGSRLDGATVAVDVRDDAGTAVHQRGSGLRVMPASTQKLMTAAGALELLGPGHRFRTTVRADGGALYLHGQGDPTMTYARFDRLAAAVARAGTHRYARLVADDTWFDRVPLGLDWSWQDEPHAYSAPVSALTFAANDRFDTAAVEIRYRGVAGRRPVVAVWPPTGSVRVVNRAITRGPADTTAAVRARGSDTVTAVRAHGSGAVTVSGAVPAGRAGTALVSVPDPAATAADLFRAALRRHGVTIARRTTRGSSPGAARIVTAQASPPLREILPPLLKFSNNGIAELLVKAMSRAAFPERPGSWPTGLAAVTSALGRLGVDTRLLTMGDGSGLSRRNWVTARQLTTLLAVVRRRPWFPAFRAALPVAGDPDPLAGGTLRDRMRGTPAAGAVRAKTGTMTGVNALAGYVTDGAGRHLVFAVVVNNAVAGVADLIDRFAVALAVSGTRPDDQASAV
ncbi:D-alanyl-D-alanine carboxypeptidase/D-alanyl-D-alanine-endopeptidase [Actinoplanes sp. NEAU-A12]|uniref:D-alanyl-D-alanine carboxypeptidase/D-alanyl-D-alanine-endopeptidase n=1 Tax=Actinoplanes sandaracinus TaxID=3045177 RepID=A0ABT6WRA0_9ACTN|nr:D-alanyl-D-alanine carboxypeptidase/D-alanyl-D-alanine-endopeptidase [Actinoplanes sandaracinus]MDI6102223.1 D-alanyl-D-alanine carboxypeptidase/D-alanyl-D-alanine-endopeptidase [Actinoplanes sandaracinus]